MYIFIMSHLLYQAPHSRADQKRETQTERHDNDEKYSTQAVLITAEDKGTKCDC